jgi:hypothetical protein
MAMPPRSEPAVSAAAELRRLQRRLPQLPVPTLLSLRELLEPTLAAERITVDDVDRVLAAAGGD